MQILFLASINSISVPHILSFLKDSVTSEWWEPGGDLRCYFYHPYRRIVDVQNSQLSTSTGHHQLLVPQDGAYDQNYKLRQPASSRAGSFLWWTTGLAMGITIGAIVVGQARRR
jgi:hypothetical protein